MASKYYRFAGVDSYDTPEEKKASWGYRLALCKRLYFYWHIFGIFCKTGALGRKGLLDKEQQIRYSSCNLDLIENCGGKYHLRGLNHLREIAGEPVVLVANHMSLLETGILHAIMREYVDFGFVVKESLTRTVAMKDILNSLGVIPISRTNPREDLKTLLTKGKELLKSGKSIIVFPQGSRSRDFDRENFNTIGIKLALSANVRIVPFALKTDFLGQGKLIRDLGPIHPQREVWFECGEPLTITGRGQEEHKKTVDFIEERVNAWRQMENSRGIK